MPKNSAEPTARRPGVAAARHAVEVLRCVSQAGGSIGINEIARRIGLHKSSISRVVATLEDEGLLEREPASERIILGIGLIAIAAPILTSRGISTIAHKHMERLAHDTGETASFSVWNGLEAISLDQVIGTNAITHYAGPGQSNAPHCTASGKLLLAFAPEAEIEAILAESLPRHTPHTITDPQALRGQIDEIRMRGFAINRGELSEDAGGISAIVRDLRHRPVGAITITLPMYRFDEARQDELVRQVCNAASRISLEMGCTEGGPGKL
ncbi:IclR family transcriptional regulator [Afifella marina]|uniref:Transcriptional regulator, IclR family n=1 Tax=Afifella marina DSM 2698 TaxID=1120955 RepID=A0A1G5NXL2_AFIMA|nr:IclR family transcriptional regulator [Afifella marina]MBK1624492.1 IclR family transcriptional regulator [Afifella marina DSM 2698]MBK1628224.1 IclR family transcriptional regulator [Afifella marina]MBK5916658.1 hypothetical protein [Afifella marina]RAI19010.1 hypothetical protein CH311_14290 [Afifella marina DSM 2698]SCZ42063.1 transcriptional regulator, IclR family [Afifella marina DSM 2698]